MTRVLLTGSSGFIGQHLAKRLVHQGYTVAGLDVRVPANPITRVAYQLCDLLDARQVEEAFLDFGPEAVLHLAARTDLNEQGDLNGYAVNIAGVENLIAAIRKTPGIRRCICTSTRLVCRIGYAPINDEDYKPTTLYGESKVRTEQIWRERDGGGVEWCLVRPTMIWGPGMNPHYLTFFRMIRDRRYFHVGRGLTHKSYGYVGNTVHQYMKLLEAPTEQIHRMMFYLADYEPIVLEEWADAFQRAMGAPPIKTVPLGLAVAAARMGDLVNWLGVTRFPFNSFRLNNVITPYQADLSATKAVCGALPYTMQQGVDETVRWLRSVWREQSAA